MNLKPYISTNRKAHILNDQSYVVVLPDKDHHRKVNLGGVVDIIIQQIGNFDHRQTHPTIGVIVEASEGAQFKVGTEIMCNHFTFEDHIGVSQHFYEDEDGVRYFHVKKLNVMFGIIEGELVPRDGILLCEPVNGKFINTSLELQGKNEGKRRDIAKVIKTSKGCEMYKAGDYVMLKMGADYPIKWKGKDYLKVDHYFNDTFGITDLEDTYDSVVRHHVTHGSTNGDL